MALTLYDPEYLKPLKLRGEEPPFPFIISKVVASIFDISGITCSLPSGYNQTE